MCRTAVPDKWQNMSSLTLKQVSSNSSERCHCRSLRDPPSNGFNDKVKVRDRMRVQTRSGNGVSLTGNRGTLIIAQTNHA